MELRAPRAELLGIKDKSMAERVCRAEHARRRRIESDHPASSCWCTCRACAYLADEFRRKFGRPHRFVV